MSHKQHERTNPFAESFFMQDILYSVGFSCPQVFREQGIDGETLPLLTEEHLLNTMGLKLGPALKIRAQVSVLINLERAEGFFVTGDGLPVPFIWQVLTQLHLFVGSQAPGPCLLHGQFPCGPSVAVNKPASP